MTLYTGERVLLKNIRAGLAVLTGRPVGLVEAPVVDSVKPDYPYGIVYPIPGGVFSGSMDQPDEDAEGVVQVTSVGETVDSVLAMAALVRSYFLSREPDGAFAFPIDPGEGWAVVFRRPTIAPGVDPGGKALFSVPETFILSITADPGA